MHTSLRRALAVTAAGACLAVAGSLGIPAAVAAITDANLAASAQRLDVSSRVAASVERSQTPRDGFTISEFALVQWPLVEGTSVSSFFGYRSCDGCSSFHSGIDFTPGAGVPIEAIADGTVVGSTVADGSWGTHVTIEHDIDGVIVRSSYAHMQSGSMTLSIGDTVTRGQVLGRVGNTGQSMGAHLHFTIQTADGTFINPLTWMREHVNIGHDE
jgi:murein DD-endopeptidase MepM/ murein hydrolase activator NlpD